MAVYDEARLARAEAIQAADPSTILFNPLPPLELIQESIMDPPQQPLKAPTAAAAIVVIILLML